MMKCENCGNENKENSIFCTSCGNKLLNSTDEEVKNEDITEQFGSEEFTEIIEEVDTDNENLDKLVNTRAIILDNQENIDIEAQEDKTKFKRIKKFNSKIVAIIKNLSIKKKIAFIVVAVLILSAIGGISYANVIKPMRAENKITLGNKYLNQGKYEPAVLAFKKAIKIDPKNMEARIGLAKAYIKLNKLDKAEKALLDAHKIDPENAEVILMLADLWKDKNGEELYKIVSQYMKKVIPPNPKIKKLYEEMIAAPGAIKASLPSGKYTDETLVSLSTVNNTRGSSIYYTLDGSEPNKNSTLYSKPIKIVSGHTTLKCLDINVIDVSGDVISFEYDIDIQYKNKLKELITSCQAVHDASEEGNTPGKYPEGAKKILLQMINNTKELISKTSASQEEIDKAFEALNKALSEFKEKMIPVTNKENLINTINEVQRTLDNVQEGSGVGQYPSGSKSVLQNALNNATKINADTMAKQDIVDNTNSALRTALSNLISSAIKDTLEQEMNSRLNQAGAQGGQIKISLMWNNTDDLDLHCITSSGQEIYYGYKSDSTGGKLDVDANANSITTTPVENIVWTTAPAGNYKISVKCYTKRASGSTPFTVFVSINNAVQKFTGNLSTGGETQSIYNFNFSN